MSCPQQASVVNSDLETLRRNAVQNIKGSLYLQAQPASQSAGCQIQIATAGIRQLIPLSADVNIIELDPIDIFVNYPAFPINGGRGVHDPRIGKIILCRGRWCEETLIHETLHSLSFSSVRMDLRRTYLAFFEGLTEFFAGYVMFCRYHDCYEAWKGNNYSSCSVTYVQSVRLWAAFCRFIPIVELVKTYFWDGTPDWEARCLGLLEAVHQVGYPHFDDFRRRPTPTVEGKILEECLENFGRLEFQSIYEGPLSSTLDFSEMLGSGLPLT